MWATRMTWSGQAGFSEAKVEERPYGLYKKYKNFEFQKVYGAGHYVPMDRPEQSLSMLWDFLGMSDNKSSLDEFQDSEFDN